MASEKKDDWVHYSVAAGASFAYFLALPSFANVDKNFINISTYLFGLSLIWNSLLSVGLRKDKNLNRMIFSGLGEVGHLLYFSLPLLIFGLAILCFIWSISGSVVLFIISGIFTFIGVSQLSLYRQDKSQTVFTYRRASKTSYIGPFLIASILVYLATSG